LAAVPVKLKKLTQEEFNRGIQMLKQTLDSWIMLADPPQSDEFEKMRSFVDIIENSLQPAGAYDQMKGPAKRKKVKRAVFDSGINSIVDELNKRIDSGDPMMKKRYEKVRGIAEDLIGTCRPPADYTG